MVVSSLFVLSILCLSTAASFDNYIVHMDLSSMPKVFSTRETWFEATISSLSPNSKILYTYTHVLDGFSACLSLEELDALKKHPAYIHSIKDMPLQLHTTHSHNFLQLNAIFGAWKASQFGDDIIIGLVDSGVWPESKSFDDQGMSDIPSRWKGTCQGGNNFSSSLCNKKLIGARYFNKGYLASLPRNSTLPININSARDDIGHGTHTASIAAGNYVDNASYYGYASGTAIGTAPRASVAMYKAMSNVGSHPSDVIAAIDQAVVDGVDILSLSIGGEAGTLYDNAIAVATFAAVEKGITVVASAGNSGFQINSVSNGAPWLLTVAAGTMDRQFCAHANLENGETIIGSSLYHHNFSSSNFPIVFLNNCGDIHKKNPGKIVVCETNFERSGDVFKKLNDDDDNDLGLAPIGAEGVILIIDVPELENIIRTPYPIIFVRPKEGETIKAYLKSTKEAKASLRFKITQLGTNPAPMVSSYSSRGPSLTCPYVLKPDILAPGTFILAAWPPTSEVDHLYGRFNLLSGTSMSCPMVAGVAALIKSVHRDWSPAAIRSAMITTAYILDNTNTPIKDYNLEVASALAIGGGHVDPNKALHPGLVYDAGAQDYLNLLCGMNMTESQIRAITRSSTKRCDRPSKDLNYPSFIAFFNMGDSATIVQFERTVTNVGDAGSSYVANLKGMEGFEVVVIPKKLNFVKKGEKKRFKLIIKGSGSNMKQDFMEGHLKWLSKDGKFVVRSPIVATKWSAPKE